MSSSSPSFPQHRMDLMLCRCRMWAPPTSLCLGTCQLTVMASHQLQFVLQWCSGGCPAPYCDQLQYHRPPPLHFVHVHVCLLCYCVQHAWYMYMICAQYVICWTGPPVTPAGTALQLEWASSVLQPACPGTLCTLQSLSLCSMFLCSYPSLLLPFFLSCLTYSLPPSLPLSCPPVVMYM